jgi:arylsulfatase A-like enzyme
MFCYPTFESDSIMPDNPNVLWIFSDQHRGHAMSCAGDPNVDTPNLDRLAREGVRFTSAYANSPICSPFRATLYTGQYIHTHGVYSLHRPLLPRQAVLAEVLRDAGYHTSHMGKWHLAGGAGPTHYVSPYFRPGWDEWLGWENSNEPFATEYHVGAFPKPVRTLEKYQTDALTDFTVDWLRQVDRESPWFHVISVEPPHPPNDAPEPYMAMFRDKPLQYRPNMDTEHENFQSEIVPRLRAYYAQIKNLDDNVGRILAALEETGQLENTVIWYFADHGDLMGCHGHMGKCAPEEESTCIPLIVRGPGAGPAGRVCGATISSVDFMPTLLGMLDVPAPEGMEGTDCSSTVAGRDNEGAPWALLQFEQPFFNPEPKASYRALRMGRWKIAVPFLDERIHKLFDLDADPYEMHNLYDDPGAATDRDRMYRKLVEVTEGLGDDFFERRKTGRPIGLP